MSVTTPQHHRVGAHRARRNPMAVTAIGIGAIVALSALLVWGLVATGVIGGGGEQEVALGEPTGGLGEATGGLVEQPPSVSPPPEASISAPPTSAPPVVSAPAGPDQSVSITVLNGGVTVSGVARGTASSLVTAGWTGVDEAATANAPTFPDVPTTLITYADPALQPTAEAIAAQLGQGAATLTSDYASAGFVTQIVVVLGADFVPPA